MPHFQLPISPNGALLSLFVGVSAPRASALVEAKQPVPPAILVQGLLDTGASGVCIDPSVVQQLSLQATGVGYMITPSTGSVPVPTPLYDISIRVPYAGSSLDFDSVPAMESVLSNQGFAALIGRDILSKCLIVYDGETGFLTLAF